jgi:hypothetical protein
VGRRTHLVEHVGATIMATRKARLDSFLEFDYIGRSGVHKFLEYQTRVDPNVDKTYICQPPIQDFRITYGPSSSSARTIFVDIHEVEAITFGAVKKATRKLVESIESRVLRAVDPSDTAAKRGRPTISFGFSDGTFLLNSKAYRKLHARVPARSLGESGKSLAARRRRLFSVGNSQAKTSSGRERSATRITLLDAVVVRRKNGQKKWDKGIIVDGLGNRHESMELETFGVVDIISRKPTRTQRVTWSRVVGRRN